MRIAKNYKKDIFCLEGDWQKDLRDKSSINAALTFLQQNFNIRHIYKQCGTRENLEYYLSLWKQKKYAAYSICYFAFHGEPESIKVGKEFVTLDELGDMLADSCKDKIIHFGSCKTLDTNRKNIIRFLERTGALCVCGFETDIDFLESSVFDMLLIEKFQKYKDISKVERDIRYYYGTLVRKLKFNILYL
ncbi:MAG TPA: DUF6642 family protein [Bacteroidia bacterium]|nr:DUF6642 family protein [Bacteroidia bacterium]